MQRDVMATLCSFWISKQTRFSSVGWRLKVWWLTCYVFGDHVVQKLKDIIYISGMSCAFKQRSWQTADTYLPWAGCTAVPPSWRAAGAGALSPGLGRLNGGECRCGCPRFWSGLQSSWRTRSRLSRRCWGCRTSAASRQSRCQPTTRLPIGLRDLKVQIF